MLSYDVLNPERFQKQVSNEYLIYAGYNLILIIIIDV